jgi:hypothetical protein
MNVFTFWSGPMPDWIGWCIDSIRHQCRRSTFHLITPDNAGQYVTDDLLCRRWRSIAPGVGTDCLRAALLAQHGGLWMDADTVCLRDPEDLMLGRSLEDQQIALYSRWPSPPDRIIAGYFYAPAQHPVALEWLAQINAALKWSQNIGWGELGEQMLTPIIRRSPAGAWEMPLATFLPLDVDKCVYRLFGRYDWRECITDRTIGFGLNYSWMRAHHGEKLKATADEVSRSPLMIHRLLTEGALA